MHEKIGGAIRPKLKKEKKKTKKREDLPQAAEKLTSIKDKKQNMK